MKDFSKMVLATIVGIFATFIIFSVLMLMSIVGMVASGTATMSAPKHSVFVLNLNGLIDERAQENPFAKLFGDDMGTTGLNDILSAIKKAKTNEDIDCIYMECGMVSTGYATLQEIRNALVDYKKSGKKIIAYADNYSQPAYYLASVADKVYLNPSGSVDIHGIGSQTMFVKDLYAKFGIKYQVIKVGTYKSATEMYTEERMSDANREQVKAYIDGLWGTVTKSIAESRKISVADINTMADSLTMLRPAAELKAKKLVDGLLYTDQIRAEVKKVIGLDEDETISQLSVTDMVNIKEERKDGEEIAVYYASGQIYDSPLTGIGSMGSSQIIGNEMSRDLEELMNDDDVKAVVIRVNSPGGSAYASEQIWHMVTKLKEKKPVVVSMGDYAASGGYYISCNANWIVAQPTTLTGSIGIFGVIPEASELLEQKLGLHFDGYMTNKHSDLGSGALGFPVRPFDVEEQAMFQNYINHGYQLFRKRCADGRKMKVEDIEAIAQGRVWLGEAALKNKLVDELGGLDVAIAKAAKLAKLDEYYTTEYPGEADFLDQLSAAADNGNYLDEQMRLMMGDFYQPFTTMRAIYQQSPIQASMPMILNIK